MKKLIIISDSHGNNKEILNILENNKFDISIIAGDYETDLDFIKKHFTYHVKGNNDFDKNNNEIFFSIGKFKFYLQHGHLMGNYNQLDDKEYMKKILELYDVDVIIHGHTHITKVEEVGTNKFIVNPGSITYPRGNSNRSFLICNVYEDKIDFEIKTI